MQDVTVLFTSTGGNSWENADNRKAVVRAFLNKIDLKKVEAVE